MEHLRGMANVIVLRACGFAALAIFCTMIGFSFAPRLAFQTGGFFSLMLTLALALKAYETKTRDYKRTELWLYLPKENRPPHNFAQKAIATVMRETYLSFARRTAFVSVAMWGIAFLFMLVEWGR